MNKLEELRRNLSKFDKLCVAYSGGVDSDFLLNVAKDVLGENVIAVIGNGEMVARKDLEDAVRLANMAGVKNYVVNIDVFSVPEFSRNTKLRCYYCKKNIMTGIINKAQELGFEYIADGKNADDGKVYRPGAKASVEMGIVSPLYEAGFTKKEIRQYSSKMGLETWDKAANSCLATRFPYDTDLDLKKFESVEKAEKLLADKGIKSGRVRVHGEIARIEMPKEYFVDFISDENIVNSIKETGFKYVTLDLEGFRSGSMD